MFDVDLSIPKNILGWVAVIRLNKVAFKTIQGQSENDNLAAFVHK